MPDIHAVIVPKWGLSMEEGTILTWHAAYGSDVAAGADLVDIETTKITNTLEAQHGGQLRRVLAQPGQTLRCGQLIAVIADAAVTSDEIDAFIEHYSQDAAEANDGAPATPQAAFLEVNGRRIRYLDTGNGDIPLVFVHGFGGDLENWMFNQPALSTCRRAIALDLPGHGASSKEVGDGSPEVAAAAVAGVLQALDIGPIHLVAHSYGAAVAAALHQNDPNRIRTLTLIAPVGFGRDINAGYIAGFIAARRRSDMSVVVRMLFADGALATADMAEGLLRYKRLDGVVPALQAIAAGKFGDGVQHAVSPEIWRELGDRMLVIWGDRDRIIPPSHLEAVPQTAQRSLIAGAGHMPHVEAAETVNKLISAHLDKFQA